MEWLKDEYQLGNYNTNEEEQDQQTSELDTKYKLQVNNEAMLALQQSRVGTEQKIKAREEEEKRKSDAINNLMNMALHDSNRIIDGDQYNGLFKAFRPSMPDDEATKSFIAANYVMRDDYNSWYANSGYSNKISYRETEVVNAKTSVVNGDLVVTIPGTGNSTPNFWSIAQNVGGGLYDAGESAVSGIWNMGRHPIDTAKNIFNAGSHPIDTVAAIWEGVSTSFEEDVINGNGDRKAHFFGRAVGEVVLGAFGTKGLDKATKVIRGGEVVTADFVRGASKATGAREMSVEEYFKRENQANEIYNNIRNTIDDVSSIAKNTGMPAERVRRIKDHLFNNEHILTEGKGKFAPDYYIAQAWNRLKEGTHTKSDIDLLNHELFESKFEGIFQTDYGTAHSATNKSGRTWTSEE